MTEKMNSGLPRRGKDSTFTVTFWPFLRNGLSISIRPRDDGETGLSFPIPNEAGMGRRDMVLHPLRSGFRPTDRVFLPFVYNVYIAFWQGIMPPKSGMRVGSGRGPGDKARIQKMMRCQSNGLDEIPPLTPSHGRSSQEMGIDPKRDIESRDDLCGGAMPEADPAPMEEEWGAEAL